MCTVAMVTFFHGVMKIDVATLNKRAFLPHFHA